MESSSWLWFIILTTLLYSLGNFRNITGNICEVINVNYKLNPRKLLPSN